MSVEDNGGLITAIYYTYMSNSANNRIYISSVISIHFFASRSTTYPWHPAATRPVSSFQGGLIDLEEFVQGGSERSFIWKYDGKSHGTIAVEFESLDLSISPRNSDINSRWIGNIECMKKYLQLIAGETLRCELHRDISESSWMIEENWGKPN